MLQLSGDGTIGGLQVGGLPNATVTQAEMAANVSTTGPVFSAYQSVVQSFGAGATNKLLCQTEEFDIGGTYDATTSRFQPTVAGYYQMSFGAALSTAVGNIAVHIYKNGTIYKSGSTLNPSGNTSGSALVYLNGSTDYLEVYTYSSTAQNSVAAINYTFFQGFLARAA